MKYSNLLQLNLPFILGAIAMFIPASFWLAIGMSLIFNNGFLMEFFGWLDHEYWYYSMIVLVVLPAVAFIYNTLYILKLEMRCEEDRIWFSAGIKPLLLNACVVGFAALNIFLVLGYFFLENYRFVGAR